MLLVNNVGTTVEVILVPIHITTNLRYVDFKLGCDTTMIYSLCVLADSNAEMNSGNKDLH